MSEKGNIEQNFSELALFKVSPNLAPYLDIDFCTSNHISLLDDPADKDLEEIRIGTLNTEDKELLKEAEALLGKPINPIQLNAYEIENALSRIYETSIDNDLFNEISLSSSSKIDFSKDRQPNLILQDILSVALQRSATDIHIENYNNDADLRLRVDGALHQVTTSLSPINIDRVIACIKILCDLDHLERKKSQDGRFSANYEDNKNSRKIDFRVSIIPGNYGQETVIRVMDPKRVILDLNKLGMPKNILKSYSRMVNYPSGLILTTGPTGSGKTSTLYASVQNMVTRGLKVMTAEDPVEYEMKKVNQKSINEFMGFADYIRSFLRQNPDTILVGEIRDNDTAEIAIKASTTGHLVLSSLHSRSAIGTISRLRNLGVPNDNISSNLLGSIGQRLIRKICESCKEETSPNKETLDLFYDKPPKSKYYYGRGCDKCNDTGYNGLMGVYELFFPTNAISSAIGSGAPTSEIRELAAEHGFIPLVENALEKVHQGLTTLEEVSMRIGPKFPHA